MQFWMQIMHTREQCIGYHLELRSYRLKSRLKNLRKFERRSVLSTLQLFVEEKVLTCLFSCNFEIANLTNESHLQTSASFKLFSFSINAANLKKNQRKILIKWVTIYNKHLKLRNKYFLDRVSKVWIHSSANPLKIITTFQFLFKFQADLKRRIKRPVLKKTLSWNIFFHMTLKY